MVQILSYNRKTIFKFKNNNMTTNENLVEVLNDLVEINNDRIEGYQKAAE